MTVGGIGIDTIEKMSNCRGTVDYFASGCMLAFVDIQEYSRRKNSGFFSESYTGGEVDKPERLSRMRYTPPCLSDPEGAGTVAEVLKFGEPEKMRFSDFKNRINAINRILKKAHPKIKQAL